MVPSWLKTKLELLFHKAGDVFEDAVWVAVLVDHDALLIAVADVEHRRRHVPVGRVDEVAPVLAARDDGGVRVADDERLVVPLSKRLFRLVEGLGDGEACAGGERERDGRAVHAAVRVLEDALVGRAEDEAEVSLLAPSTRCCAFIGEIVPSALTTVLALAVSVACVARVVVRRAQDVERVALLILPVRDIHHALVVQLRQGTRPGAACAPCAPGRGRVRTGATPQRERG